MDAGPETTTIPLPVRAEWIRRLYPAVEVIETWDGPREVGDIPYDDSWDRSGEVNCAWMQDQIRKDLAERGDAFFELRGSVDQRAARVKEVLARPAGP